MIFTSAMVSQLIVALTVGAVGWVGAKLHSASAAKAAAAAAPPPRPPAPAPSLGGSFLGVMENALQSHVGEIALSLVGHGIAAAVESKNHLPPGTLTNLVPAAATAPK